MRFDGRGAWLSFDDSGPEAFDFTNGDALTLGLGAIGRNPPWRKRLRTAKGEPACRAAPDNQNGPRVREVRAGLPELLFATPRAGACPAPIRTGIAGRARRGSGLAAGITSPRLSIRRAEASAAGSTGGLKPAAGTWGETREAPVVDDAIWIGSERRLAGNSFRGVIDAVAVIGRPRRCNDEVALPPRRPRRRAAAAARRGRHARPRAAAAGSVVAIFTNRRRPRIAGYSRTKRCPRKRPVANSTSSCSTGCRCITTPGACAIAGKFRS